MNDIQGQRTTKYSSIRGFIGKSSLLSRSNFSVSGQECCPESLTAAYSAVVCNFEKQLISKTRGKNR